MSDVARTWAAAQDTPNRNAHDVLKEMAQWADASGEAWVLVGLLARACKCTERTVQRGLADLKGCGLLIDTGEKKRHAGRLLPIYQLPIDTGHANLMRRMKAEADALAGEVQAVDKAAWGDSGVTPSGALGVTPVSPHGCHPCHPTGDSGVTQIGKEKIQGLTPCASGRESETDQDRVVVDDAALTEAMAAWARKAPERVGAKPVRSAWADALTRSKWAPSRMCAAVTACVARDPDFARGKAMNLHRWLDDARYLSWDQSAAGEAARAEGSPAVAWSGPNRVREIVNAEMGERAAVSYLDPSSWDEARSVIVVRTGLACERLRDRCGPAFAAMGVTVERAHV